MGSPVCRAARAVYRCSLPSESWLPAASPAPLQRTEDKNDHHRNHRGREHNRPTQVELGGLFQIYFRKHNVHTLAAVALPSHSLL